MSRPLDDREGLSPPPATIYDMLTEDDEEDDDIYEPATDGTTDLDDIDGDEEEEYLDAAEAADQSAELEIQFEEDTQDEEQTETETEAQPRTTTRTTTITLRELNQLIGRHAAIRRLFQNHSIHIGFPDDENGDDDDDDDDDPTYGLRRRRRRKTPADPNRFPKIPSDAGRSLMHSGVFGIKDNYIDIRRKRRRTLNERLLWRKLGFENRSHARQQTRYIAQETVPSTSQADRIIHYDSRAYSGQFSDDGNFFFSCTQNFKVRMYDTSNPYDWKYYKTVDYPYGQWTITDATLSPDNKFLAYSSIRHTVCLAPTDPLDNSEHNLLDFANYAPGAAGGDPRFGYMGRHHGFGIYSLRFSGDGREIVAGTSDSAVVVYDLETRKSILRLAKHTDDVNAVCFGDKMSPHILYSGSDDATLRVWDRRSMADRQEAGVFVGHTEGLTYVDTKGDGRYVLSNGKDQMMKLWDLRRMATPAEFANMNLSRYTSNFDYRFSHYDPDDYRPNPDDCSVTTFRGHRVLKTLIRCHFSPPTSSNSRYVYSGSEDGKVWIYNLDGTVKSKIDVYAATKNTRDSASELHGYGYDGMNSSNGWKTCVRDASWSPTVPMIAATSWNGYGMSTGTVSVHSWNDASESDDGDPPLGSGYNARMELRDDLNAHLRTRGQRAGVPGLRSRTVRPQRFGAGGARGGGAGAGDEDHGAEGGGGGW